MSSHAGDGAGAARAAQWALLAGNFVIGTGVMIVAGTLNEISRAFRVEPAVAGQLITAAAAVMCIGAPLLASAVARWDRRVLLTLSLLWYAAGHLAALAVTGLGELMALRMLTVIAPAVFTPQAAACIGQLVPATERGRAVTFIFLGWSLASVAGLPLGAFIGGRFGWQAAFVAVAAGAVLAAAWVWRTLPPGVRPAPMSRRAWGEVARHRLLPGVIAVTVLQAAGQFVVFSFFAPLLRRHLGADAVQLGLVWAWFGAFGLLGNVLASRLVDRLGTGRVVLATTACMATGLLCWPLGLAGGWLALAAVLLPWGLGCFAANSAQQARLVALAPALAAGSVALNSSAMYAGQAAGTAVGGWLMARGADAWMNWAGVLLLLGALGLSALLDRRAGPHR
ncbi:MFS transporter [Xenophilus azovorans]|uniref:MFS transporter n=1 Tax=Xenophilus azovorans TaxID=151755 RepID=UPI00056FF9EF|nr:MFS transporter [Xenophilus azovorans]